MAKRQPDTLAIAWPVAGGGHASWTYSELNRESNRAARGLEGCGIRQGMRTVLMVKPGPEFFALTFALFKIGAVPVLVDPGLGRKNLKRCLAEAEPEAFIGIPKAHAARILFGWARRSLRRLVTVGGPRLWGGADYEALKSPDASAFQNATRTGDAAAILFTSGGTGAPKGAVYTHGNFAAQVDILREIYGIEPGEVDLPTFPLFALFAPALGMSAVIPDMDFTRPAAVDPAKIVAAIRKFNVTQMFGSPALIRRVGAYLDDEDIQLTTVRRVISAGAPVPAATLARFTRHLPKDAEVHTPYGATEALPVATIGSREILAGTCAATAKGAGVCVGRPVGGVRVRIIRITDRSIPVWSDDWEAPPGEIGEIVVAGPVVTGSYHNRARANRRSKIPAPERGGFYHRMGDLGYFDHDGRLWFCGRKSHRVPAPDRLYYTIPCEGVFNEHPQVYRTALVGVRRGRIYEPVLCVEREHSGEEVRLGTLRDELLALGAAHEHTRDIKKILFHDAFPVDIRHNAKIFREQLAVWAEDKLRW
ncbi:MAG: fatty acid CoA ligase family protein [Elusimicrobiota bacterium]